MARDGRKVALAVLAAVAVASAGAPTAPVAAQQSAKSSKSSAKGSPPAAKSDEGEEAESKASAKKKRQDPAEAQRAIEGAGKLLQAGKAEQASQALTVTLAGGNLPPAIMARALYLRGVAYRQQSKPAQAISDLTSALWLKGGLTAEDRADALKQRVGAYADAGLTETGAVAAPKTAAASETKERPAAKTWGSVTTPTEDSATSNAQSAQAGGNWFKNWFNTWSPPPAQAKAPPPSTASIERAAPEEAPPAPKTPRSGARISGAWSSKTEVSAEPAPAPSRAMAPQPAAAPAGRAAGPQPAAGKQDGKYRVQIATVRTQREAEALAAKAKRALGDLAGRDPEIDQAVLGNMGSFYRVRVGPFSTAQEAQGICAKVKATGFDCLAVTQ